MLKDNDRKNVWDAIDRSRATRAALRRSTRKGGPVRQNALRMAQRELQRAMKPVRREIHRTQYQGPSRYRDGLLTLSGELQRERRKIWKMMQPSTVAERRQRSLLDRIRDTI